MSLELNRHYKELARKRAKQSHNQTDIAVKTPCACSCHMCRNPRTSNLYKGKSKLTIQERKALQEHFHLDHHVLQTLHCRLSVQNIFTFNQISHQHQL